MIRAAGGVILRGPEVLLVHRPRYDDWSLPKGKLEPGESWQDAARREVEEETGLVCDAGDEVGRTTYDVRGKSKEVRYFRMSTEGEPRAQNEVDEVRWVSLAKAARWLAYEGERELLKRLR